MNFNSLYDVYIGQLKDMYSAEKQLVEALPKMAQAASTKELKEAFQEHWEKTKGHQAQVQAILDAHNENPGSTKCKAMEGLIEEGQEVINTKGDAKAKDAALILAAQKVEHYEIATYGGLRTFAERLGYDDVADILQQVLDQEYEADELLDEIAMSGLLSKGVNEQALR